MSPVLCSSISLFFICFQFEITSNYKIAAKYLFDLCLLSLISRNGWSTMIIPRSTLSASGCSLHQAFVYLKNKKQQSTSLPPFLRSIQLRNKHMYKANTAGNYGDIWIEKFGRMSGKTFTSRGAERSQTHTLWSWKRVSRSV